MEILTPTKPPSTYKENLPDTPTSLPTLSQDKQQRVVFSEKNNKHHFFPPLLPVHPTPAPDSEPSKSILKKRSYDEFLADLHDFPVERAPTPEPESPHEEQTYLLRPIQTIVDSMIRTENDLEEGEQDLKELIEAYCVLTARIKSNLLPGSPSATTTTASEEVKKAERKKEWDENVLQPAMLPLKEALEPLTKSLERDISRARQDPIQSCARLLSLSQASQSSIESTCSPSSDPKQLPSPPPSSPAHCQPDESSPVKSDDFAKSDDSIKTGAKKGGMNEVQVKHARDLCTLSQSALKFFSALLCFTKLIHAGSLFSESQLCILIGAVLAIPLASPLPTPNSRKTCALAVSIITSFSTLPLSVLSSHASSISNVYKRSINGELGREGKKGSISDSLRGIVLYSFEHPQHFGHPFGILLPSLLKLVQANNNSQTHAGYSLTALAYASTEVATPIPGVSKLLGNYLSLKNRKRDDLPPIFLNAMKAFQNAIQTGNAEINSTVGGKTVTPQLQTACQTSAMWHLSLLAGVLVLTGEKLWHDGVTAPAVAKILRVLLGSKRVAVRTAASWGWRAFCWGALKWYENEDWEERVGSLRRCFDFLEKGVGVGLICALLVGTDGREDREQRVELAIEALLDLAAKRTSAEDSMSVLGALLADEEYEEPHGPSAGWDYDKLLPLGLFDGSLAESDAKGLHAITKAQIETEKAWIEDIPPLMRSEVEEHLESLFDAWAGALKSYGVDDKGYPTPFVVEKWSALLKRSYLIPDARVLAFVTEPPHTWTNLASPGQARQQTTAHQVVQARYIKMLWLGLIQRFGNSPDLQKLALKIYDESLNAFDLSEGKVEDVCLEMFYFLAEVESKVVVLMMGHEDWQSEMKKTFWGKACVAAKDSDLMRALCLAPFGEPVPFEMEEGDWETWESVWERYLSSRGPGKGRMIAMKLFVEELGENLPPVLSARITGYLLGSFPHPVTDGRHIVLSFVDQSLNQVYAADVREAIELTITNLHSLTEALVHLRPSHLLPLTPTLVQWIADEEGLMTDQEYDIIIGQTYGAILDCLAREVVDNELLCSHAELLSTISKRITPSLKTIRLFKRFWVVHCERVDREELTDDLRSLLDLVGSDDLDEEPKEEEARQPPSDDSCGSDEVRDLLATADALEDEEEKERLRDIERPQVKEQATSESIPLSDPSSDGFEPSSDRIISPKISPVHSPALLPESAIITRHSLHDKLAALDVSDDSSEFQFSSEDKAAFGTLSRGSPNSRKRSLDEDDDCTPIKRRKQDGEEEDVDDSTPVKPWFGDDDDDDKPIETPPIPFLPFAPDNSPKGVFQFSASPNRNDTFASKRILLPVVPMAAPVHPSLLQASAGDASKPLFVDSAKPRNNSPSAKRRRIGGPELVVSIDNLPPSDEPEPYSDDSQGDSICDSDDAVPVGRNISPEEIVSPLAQPAEPGSDDSNESPLKTYLERKRRFLEAGTHSSESSSRILDADRPTNIRSLVDLEARNAMTRAGALMNSMDKDGLMRFSSLLEQMRAKVESELRRKD